MWTINMIDLNFLIFSIQIKTLMDNQKLLHQIYNTNPDKAWAFLDKRNVFLN